MSSMGSSISQGIGHMVSATGTIMAGEAAQDSADYEANQLNYQAGQSKATAQRAAIERRRQASLVNSRVQAIAGGSGLDPTVAKLSADIAGAGEYNALVSLFQGDDAARTLNAKAGARRFEGEMSMRAAELGAFQEHLKAGESFANAFSPGGGMGGGGGQATPAPVVERSSWASSPTIMDTGTSMYQRYG